MYYVYVLVDDNEDIYIGYSADLQRRIEEHAARKVFTTSKMHNPKLYYYEAYIEETMARQREKKLKQFGSSYVGLMKRIGLR